MMSDGALSQDEIEALLKGADEAFGGDAGEYLQAGPRTAQ